MARAVLLAPPRSCLVKCSCGAQTDLKQPSIAPKSLSAQAPGPAAAVHGGAARSAAAPPASAARRGAWILALAAVLFSVMAVCAKYATRQRLSGPEVACLRFCFGLLSIVVPLGMRVRLRPQNYAALFLRGFLGGTAVLAYFAAIAHLPVGVATLLNSSSPVFVAFFSAVFLREPLSWSSVLALCVSSAGVTMVVLGNTPADASAHSGSSSLVWALVGLGSAVLSAGAVTTVRSMRQSEGSWEIFLAFCLIGALITAVPTAAHWVMPSGPALAWLLAVGVSSVAAQILMTHALRDVPALHAGLILQLTPIATFTIGVGLLHERPATLGFLGACLTIVGVTWGVRAQTSSRAPRR